MGLLHKELMKAAELLAKPDRWARLLGWASLAGLVCGISGPFGSYAANLFTRLAYWIGLFWAGTTLLWVGVAFGIVYADRLSFPRQFGVAVAVLLACVPLGVLAASGCHLFWPLRASGMRPLEWYGQTLFVAMPGAALAYWLDIGRAHVAPVHDAPRDRNQPPLLVAVAAESLSSTTRLPEHLIEAAICLQMEDHYVRVHLHGHSSLHLVAMRDVVRQIGGERGIQVHRSWWVAQNAVKAAEEDGRALTLLLVNGLRVPVARSRIALLRTRGWLAAAPRPTADA